MKDYRALLRVPYVQELSSVSIFEEYAQSVAEYSRRQFSFQEDVLDAFEGLQHSIRTSERINSFSLQSYSGLPSVWFEMDTCFDFQSSQKARIVSPTIGDRTSLSLVVLGRVDRRDRVDGKSVRRF